MLRSRAHRRGTCATARARSIYDNARQQARLIDELLDVARIVSGKLRLERTAVDLEQIVRAALESSQPAAEAKACRSSSMPTRRRRRLRRRRAAAADRLEPAVERRQVQRRRRPSRRAAAARRNRPRSCRHRRRHGHSAPSSCRGSSSRSARPTRRTRGVTAGWASGLSIVKHLVEAHGGTITASSEGEGTWRDVHRAAADPAGCPTAEHMAAARPRGAESPESLDGLSVLVLDDDRESRARRVGAPESAPRGGLTAESAAQAIEILQREHIDVHPGRHRHAGRGRLHLYQARASADVEASTTPAAALTALVREEDRQRALAFRVSAAPSEADRSGFTHRRRRTTRTAQPAIDVRKSSLLRQFRADLRVRTGTNQPEQRPRRLSSGLQRGRFMAFARGLLTPIPVLVLGATLVAHGQAPAGAQARRRNRPRPPLRVPRR